MDNIRNDVELLLAIISTDGVSWKNIDMANEILSSLLESVEVLDADI